MSFYAPAVHRQGASKCPDFRRFAGRNPQAVEYLCTINSPACRPGDGVSLPGGVGARVHDLENDHEIEVRAQVATGDITLQQR